MSIYINFMFLLDILLFYTLKSMQNVESFTVSDENLNITQDN